MFAEHEGRLPGRCIICIHIYIYCTKTNTARFNSRALEFKEYTFTIDRLPSFRTYRIKLGMTSTGQCFVPRVKELRVIALA